jgi:nicotinamidase-related amidase
MATVREGNRSALLVVDVQVGVVQECHQSAAVVERVARVAERAREAGVPVIWVQHANNELVSGSPEWQWVPQLVPAPGETLIHKHHNSAFEGTSLDTELERIGATHVVLAGAASNWCIRATAYGALERGYDLTLVEDAHTTHTMDLGNGVSIEAAQVIQELNIAMTWLSYPGRSNTACKADAVEFRNS